MQTRDIAQTKTTVLIRHTWVKKTENAPTTGKNDYRHRRPLQTWAEPPTFLKEAQIS